MLFRVVEHYDIYNNDYYIESDDNYCLICHDKEYPQLTIKLNSNIYYLKKCNCDGYIHKNCLDIWINFNRSCPYCRKKMEINSFFKKIIYKITNTYFKNIFIYYAFFIIKIKGFVFFLCWLYFISKIYYNVLLHKKMIYDNPYENKNYNYYDYYNYLLNKTS